MTKTTKSNLPLLTRLSTNPKSKFSNLNFMYSEGAKVIELTNRVKDLEYKLYQAN